MSQTFDVKNKVIRKINKICNYIEILKFSTRGKKIQVKVNNGLGENL